MATKILMPKLSDTMTEGVLATWLKKVGDAVKSGDIIAEIETDKATMEYEEYTSGVMLWQVPEKSTVPVDGLIAIIGVEGEDYKPLLNGGSAAPTPTATPPTPAPVVVANTAPVSAPKGKAKPILVPKLSDTMTEGVVASWVKNVGDVVKVGDILCEIETDKATMEYESYESGTLLYIAVPQGASAPVDALLCVIGEPGADYQPLLNPATAASAATASTAANTPPPTQSLSSTSPATALSEDERLKISPLARRMAEERGIDIQQLSGTGEGGRIVKRDVEAFVPSTTTTTAAASADSSTAPKTTTNLVAPEEGAFEEVAISQMRKTIARRLSESKFTAPHFYLTMEIRMDAAMRLREQINASIAPDKISFNDMVIKACALALRKHPAVNSSWLGDKIRLNHHINIGVAVAVDEGLLVPVVRHADQKALSQITAEVKDFAARAKAKKLQPTDWAGNTFSISNLGMFGIDEFTAIINPPDACILAVGQIKQTAVVEDNNLVVGNVMKVTLSCDHRVVDGATGASFLQTVKGYLENPMRILV